MKTVRQWHKYFTRYLRCVKEIKKGTPPMDYVKPLTQKAQGIVALQYGCRRLSLYGPGHPLMVIPGSYWDCSTTSITWPMFARPCPFRPRHGFVDSIRVYDWEGVIRLLQKAKSADPKMPVEIVVAPILTGKMSAVATNAGVTWGRENDGVTAGKDPHAVFIPVKTSKVAWHRTVSCMIDSNIDFETPEFPYLEIVEDDGNMHVVQVRDGPEQPEGVNHVVRKMRVKCVLEADPNTDLLDWEALVLIAAKQKGSVIWAPDMSLASHFCVHGIASGVPVITDHEVKVGDVIQPTKNKTSTLGKRNYAKVAAVIIETLGQDLHLTSLETQRNAILTAVATTQAQFCWGKEAHLLRLRGLSVAVLMKAVLAGCAGEIRHWATPDGPNTEMPTLYTVISGLNQGSRYRSRIYNRIFNGDFTFSKMKRALCAAKTDLGHPRWTRSFGGPRWAEVAATGVALTKATSHFCNSPGAGQWAKVVQAANRLINTSHNNGKCLTKWVTESALGMISLSPTAGFLNPYVAQVVLNMTDTGEKT